MKLDTKKDIWIYLAHKFFSNFTLNLFFIFWALLIYEKTGSMLLTLLFYLLHYLSILATISVLLNIFVYVLNKYKIKITMIIWLLLVSLSYILLFTVPSNAYLYEWILFFIAFIMAVWSSFYYIPFNTINFTLIWNSNKPWIWASFLSSNSIFAWIIASFLAISMNITNNIKLLLLFAWVSLLISCILLYFISIPHNKLDIKFSSFIRLIPFKDSFAFMELSHEMKNIWLPIVAFYLFWSLWTSIEVSSFIALWTIITIFFAGHLKDKNNNLFLIISSIIGLLCRFSFWLVSDKISFVVLGIIIWLTYKVINTNFEANFWRKLSNSSTKLEFSLANDFSKISWRVIVILVLLWLYFLTNSVSQYVLVLWWLFLIPKIILSMRKIDNLVVNN